MSSACRPLTESMINKDLSVKKGGGACGMCSLGGMRKKRGGSAFCDRVKRIVERKGLNWTIGTTKAQCKKQISDLEKMYNLRGGKKRKRKTKRKQRKRRKSRKTKRKRRRTRRRRSRRRR